METLFDFIFCFISFTLLSFFGLTVMWILDCIINLSISSFPLLCDFTWEGFRIFLGVAFITSIFGTIEIAAK